MRKMLFRGLVVAGVAMALQDGAAQVRAIDAERLLATRFGFTAAEVAQVRGGTAVAKLLPSPDAGEIGVLAAVRIDAQAERLTYWFKDIAAFRKAAELGLSHRLGDPPGIGDFADLALDAAELSALRACRPGDCDLQLGDTAIRRFQTEVDWSAADAGRRANLLMRELMLGYAQAYIAGGNQALGVAHNEKSPRVLAEEFRLLMSHSKGLYDLVPALATFLEGAPSARLADSEHFLYWAKGGAGPDASISLHQLVFYHPAGGDVFVVDKQLYASRYIDAAATVVSLAAPPDGKGFYAIVSARARTPALKGVGARMLRGKVEKATRETAAMYLNWIRASLSQ
jgi:hypothetical protein